MCITVRYSSVCETDSLAYSNYLATIRACHNAGGSGCNVDSFVGERSCGFMGFVEGCVETDEVVGDGNGKHKGSVGSPLGSVFTRAGNGFMGEHDECTGQFDAANSIVDGNRTSEPNFVRDNRDIGRVSGERIGVEVRVGESQTRMSNFGPNYERNRANREQKKRRKARKRAIDSENWRVRESIPVKKEIPVVPVVDGVDTPVTNCGSGGFWNSCSDDVRQQLIDSKARMHIADNLKRAEEAERRVHQLRSPEQLLRDAMRMVKFAEEQAKDKNDSKVRGWAKTVAESYAESIARSASTSVESFDKYLETSSVTSVSLEIYQDLAKEKDQLLEDKKKLQEEIDRLKGKKELQKYVVSTEVQTMQRYAAAAKKSVKKPACSQEHFLKVQAEKTKGVQDPYAFPWNYDREIVEYEPAKY